VRLTASSVMYFDEDVPFELLYLHSEIYRAGYKAKITEVEALAVDQEACEIMNQLFFWGILKRRNPFPISFTLHIILA
jgi:uncharacterized protein with PhoU and TrkA domain